MTARPVADVADRLPWPNVRGKRCLDIARDGYGLADELRRRGAADVESRRADESLDLAARPFDVTVAGDVLAGRRDPLPYARDLHTLTRGVLLSWEPIDLWTSLLGRGRALYGMDDDGGLEFNGGGHRALLERAGFAIERVSKPFTVPRAAPTGRIEALALRLVAGSDDGALHRAVLARPRR